MCYHICILQRSTGKELVLLGTGLKSHQKVHYIHADLFMYVHVYDCTLCLQIQLEETAKQLGARSVEGFTSQGWNKKKYHFHSPALQ